MLSFDHPLWLFLLLGLPPLAWWRHFRPGRGSAVRFAVGNWRGGAFAAPFTWQAALDLFLVALSWLALAGLVVATAGPNWVTRERIHLNNGIDLMVALDCSPSMAAQDFGNQSRLDHAKQTVRSFLAGRENDSVGLVAFGAQASLRVPPTLDYGAVREGLDGVGIMEEGDGTAIGLGLALADLHLKDSDGLRKVVVLLSDGENNAGEITPDTAAGISRSMGVKVYTVALGGDGDVPLEYVDPASGKLYRGTYRGKVDAALLRSIADRTGGQFFSAASPGSLEAVFQSIDSQERIEGRIRIETHSRPLGAFFVGLALLCALAEAAGRRLALKELT